MKFFIIGILWAFLGLGLYASFNYDERLLSVSHWLISMVFVGQVIINLIFFFTLGNLPRLVENSPRLKENCLKAAEFHKTNPLPRRIKNLLFLCLFLLFCVGVSYLSWYWVATGIILMGVVFFFLKLGYVAECTKIAKSNK